MSSVLKQVIFILKSTLLDKPYEYYLVTVHPKLGFRVPGKSRKISTYVYVIVLPFFLGDDIPYLKP